MMRSLRNSLVMAADQFFVSQMVFPNSCFIGRRRFGQGGSHPSQEAQISHGHPAAVQEGHARESQEDTHELM